jgi:membrane protein DedA with SNARE-associated domain
VTALAAEATSWSDVALGALLTYGPWALGLALLLCSAGAPVPGSILVVAAAAFARQEMMAWHWALAAAVIGVVLGDNLAYGIGRAGGAWTEKRFSGSSAWQSTVDQFNRRGAWTIFLTRWLITPIGSLVAIIAGISHFGWHRFFVLDVAGEVRWVAIYWSIGWILGSQWQAAATFLTDFSGLILGLSLLLVAVVVGVRWLLKQRRAQAALDGDRPPGDPTLPAPGEAEQPGQPVEALPAGDPAS